MKMSSRGRPTSTGLPFRALLSRAWLRATQDQFPRCFLAHPGHCHVSPGQPRPPLSPHPTPQTQAGSCLAALPLISAPPLHHPPCSQTDFLKCKSGHVAPCSAFTNHFPLTLGLSSSLSAGVTSGPLVTWPMPGWLLLFIPLRDRQGPTRGFQAGWKFDSPLHSL